MRLEGKRAIITAAGSGMGLAGARLFAREGARLALVDVDGEALGRAKEEIGGDVHTIVADLTEPAEAERIVADGAAALGGLDVLWNHAGLAAPVDIEQLDLAAYGRSHAINVTAGLVAAGRAARHMREAGGGAIVFTASTAGLVGSAYSPVYSAQKFAVVGLAMSLAQRFAKDGIRVNAICPGPIDTPMLRTFFAAPGVTLSDAEAETMIANSVKAGVPLGRPGRPDEIAQAALWLASDDASFVTGIALPVDGGYVSK